MIARCLSLCLCLACSLSLSIYIHLDRYINLSAYLCLSPFSPMRPHSMSNFQEAYGIAAFKAVPFIYNLLKSMAPAVPPVPSNVSLTDYVGTVLLGQPVLLPYIALIRCDVSCFGLRRGVGSSLLVVVHVFVHPRACTFVSLLPVSCTCSSRSQTARHSTTPSFQ
jgi:hypothetical protein